jgi:glycosyltransferase involved in cell wall biosynthesis
VLFDFQGSLTEEMIDHHFLTRTGRSYRWLRRLEGRIDQAAPIIFTSSANAENILTGEFGCEPGRIRPLPDCVNTQEFRPAASFDPAELAALRQRLGVPAGARVVVYLGLLAEYQGTPHLLQAMQRIKTTHPDVYLLMMGFPGVDFYAAQAQALDVADRVIFTGRVLYEQAPLHLALGDVAVAPKLSLTESAGKLLNYMAAALPTIAFDTPVAREYLGAHGVFAERGSVDSLAAKLADLIDNKSLADMLGDRLRQRAVEHFEWQRAGLQIVDAYGELVERPFRRRQAVAPPVPQE